MADEANVTVTQTQEQTERKAEEPHGSEPDYKAMYEKAVAESRKWEKRSKDNAEKAKKLDELTAGEASLEDRIAKLEADKKRLEDEKARAAVVAKVAEETGLSEKIVAALNGADEDTLKEQAAAVAALKPAGAPSAPEAGKFTREESGKSNGEVFADLVGGMFKH